MLADLELAAHQTLFVDDAERNTAIADQLGLNTILHDPQSGASTLRAELTSYLPQLAG